MIINVIMPDPKIIFGIVTSVADIAASHHYGIKTLLANGFSKFFVKHKPVFCNIPRNLPKNPTDWLILDNWVFDEFILAEEPFAKALPILETCVLVNYNLCRKLV